MSGAPPQAQPSTSFVRFVGLAYVAFGGVVAVACAGLGPHGALEDLVSWLPAGKAVAAAAGGLLALAGFVAAGRPTAFVAPDVPPRPTLAPTPGTAVGLAAPGLLLAGGVTLLSGWGSAGFGVLVGGLLLGIALVAVALRAPKV